MADAQPTPPVPAASRAELAAQLPPADPEPGARRRTGKGHVDSYGQDRVCAAPECETQLSRYNAAPTCWRHRDFRVGFAERWSR